MSPLDYFGQLRKDLLSEIGWTRDSDSDWSQGRCNKDTQKSVLLLLDKYLRHSRSFGVYLVTEHFEDPKYRSNSDGIVIDDGKPVVRGDRAYTWGEQLYIGTLGQRRPYLYDEHFRSEDAIGSFIVREMRRKEKNEMVTESLVFKPDIPVSGAVNQILGDIAKAAARAGDRQPRSGIREYLLRAVIRINEVILPITVDQYLSHAAFLNATAEELTNSQSRGA